MRKMVFPVVLAALLALVSCRSVSEKPRIEVSGHAVVSMEADTASFTISAECVGQTTDEARQGMDGMISSAVGILKDGYGLDDGDLETGMLSISPEYTWVDNQRVLAGQRCYQSVNVTFDDISRLGDVVEDLSGINGISLSSISLGRKNTDAEQSLARKLAVEDAMEKASDYASSIGRKVGDVVHIGDGSQTGAYPASYRNDTLVKMEASAAYSTNFYAYDIEISDTVYLVVELE